MKFIYRLIILCIISFFSFLFGAFGQTSVIVHTEAATFQSCTPAVSIVTTSDQVGTANPPFQKIQTLAAGMFCDYSVAIPQAGSYSFSVRLGGLECVHFETPVGTNVSGSMCNTSGTWFSAISTSNVTLSVGTLPIRMVVDSASGSYPSARWFELTQNAPATPALTASLALVTFPTTPQGTMAVPINLTITNTSATPVAITLANVQQLAGQGSGSDFGIFPSKNILAPIPAGASTTFLILFIPRTVGTLNGTVLIQSASQNLTVPITAVSQ